MSSLHRTSVAEVLVETLFEAGIRRVFALPGLQNLELFDAFCSAGIQLVTPCSESAVLFMADGHARVTGSPSVALVTAGPGLLNALTALAEAKLDSSPLLLLVASGQGAGRHSFQLHEISQGPLITPLAKAFLPLTDRQRVALEIRKALALASEGEPGPVVIEFASTFLLEGAARCCDGAAATTAASDASSQLDKAGALLRAASSVGIYAGAGAFGATTELLELAELLQAPVATTMSGRGVIPEDHPLAVGYGFGRSGTAVAYRVFKKITTLLAVGCKYGETATGSYGLVLPREHIHIDINGGSIDANFPATVPVVADAGAALRGLLARLRGRRRDPDLGLQSLIRAGKAAHAQRDFTRCDAARGVHPGLFLQKLRLLLQRDAILVADCGLHQFWALSDFAVYQPRTFLLPADFQSMGFGIPAAVGARLAKPGARVVALVGDGGFLMSGFECLNSARWDAAISVVVFHDGAWGLVREAQRRVYRTTPGTALPEVDYAHLAAGLGLRHVRIAGNGGIDVGLAEAFSQDGSVLIEVRVDYSEAPRYVKGAGPQMFRQLPLRLKAGLAWRWVRRSLIPGANIS